jgi:hypothetical protein
MFRSHSAHHQERKIVYQMMYKYNLPVLTMSIVSSKHVERWKNKYIYIKCLKLVNNKNYADCVNLMEDDTNTVKK